MKRRRSDLLRSARMNRDLVLTVGGFCLGILLLSGHSKLIAYASTTHAEIVRVIDGDTYVFRYLDDFPGQTAHVRIRGADTPEKGNLAKCEAERLKADQATNHARLLLPAGTRISLDNIGRDKYSRVLATVRLSDGQDMAEVLIKAGFARPYHGEKRASWCE